jgi:hypothetical protein
VPEVVIPVKTREIFLFINLFSIQKPHYQSFQQHRQW